MSAAPVLKRDSVLWQMAKRRARGRYAGSDPVALAPDGFNVTMHGRIHGNMWILGLPDLVLLARPRGRLYAAAVAQRDAARAYGPQLPDSAR